ncbi:MAG: hypothetical protein KIS62_19265 [Ramlibacter sp.]|nr:hypothetical protein [Ramlibacter sp.]
MKRDFFLKMALASTAAVGLSACGAVGKVMNLVGFKGTRLAWKEVTISAAPGANQNSPVAVDVVLVMEEGAIDKVAGLSAARWFASRSDLSRTFPGEFSYKSWEVTPGQTLRLPGATFGSPSVVTVFVFADYLAPGEHRMRVDSLQNGIMIALATREFAVSSYKVE